VGLQWKDDLAQACREGGIRGLGKLFRQRHREAEEANRLARLQAAQIEGMEGNVSHGFQMPAVGRSRRATVSVPGPIHRSVTDTPGGMLNSKSADLLPPSQGSRPSRFPPAPLRSRPGIVSTVSVVVEESPESPPSESDQLLSSPLTNKRSSTPPFVRRGARPDEDIGGASREGVNGDARHRKTGTDWFRGGVSFVQYSAIVECLQRHGAQMEPTASIELGMAEELGLDMAGTKTSSSWTVPPNSE